MTQTRRRFSESFKRETVDQVLASTPLRHVTEMRGIAESLQGKWKRQCEQQGDDAFPGNGKQRGESAELRQLRSGHHEARYFKKALAIFSQPTK